VWGTVTEAVDRQGRRVAVKELETSFCSDPVVRGRFAAHVGALTSVDHPHVVRMLEHVEAGTQCLLVSELISGGTLRERARGGVTPEVACALVLAACSGVDRAHRAGVLHRDLKPENVLFTTSGILKVSDFGLAEIVCEDRTLATRAGTVLGAPAYMAPEQAAGETPLPASDVYALATILYELLSARLPFPADEDGLATMARRVQEAPVDLSAVDPSTPPALARVVMRALDNDPAARFASADEFGAALADAAAQAWGPGWLHRTGVTVTASGAVTDRLRATRALDPPAAAETIAPPMRSQPVSADYGGETMAASAVPPAPPPPPPAATPPSASAPAAPAPAGGRRTGVIFGAAVVVVVVGIIAVVASRGGGGNKVTTIGPKAVAVDGKVAFTDTGITLKNGDDVTITATGIVFPNTGARDIQATPDGVPNRPDIRQFNKVPNVDHSGLIGRIGDNGSLFVVGHRDAFKNVADGQLFLGINDQGLENNDGSFQAQVTVKRP
jgi:hypothetical protein